MPIYEYTCKKCKKKFEVLRKFSDTTEVNCPRCQSNECQRSVSTFVTPENPGLSKIPRGKSPWEVS